MTYSCTIFGRGHSKVNKIQFFSLAYVLHSQHLTMWPVTVYMHHVQHLVVKHMDTIVWDADDSNLSCTVGTVNSFIGRVSTMRYFPNH